MCFSGVYGNFTKWGQTSTRVATSAKLKEWPSTIMQVKTAATVTPNTNNVFKDSSANNFTVTRVGATAQGAFTLLVPQQGIGVLGLMVPPTTLPSQIA